jgi:tetratricopeptide (TPR) repeat protein
LQARQQAMINAEVAVLGSLGGSAPVVVIDSNQERQAADIHSASLLAVRAARRGVARSPFDPESCLMLAKCYEERGFFAPSPDLRQDVFMANLAKFIASQPADAGYSIVLQDAAFQLSQAQYRAGRFDAAVAAYRLFASMFRRQPVSPERRPDFQEQLKNIENELTKAESALRRREDLWLNSRNDPFRALPPDQRGFTYIGARVEVQDAALARAVLAMRNGLSQKALESLRGIDLGSTSKLDFGERFVAIMSLAQTLLATGQIAEALAAMNDFESQHGNDLVAPPHLGPRLSFTLMKSQVLFAGGQFRELEELLKRQIHDLRTVLDISSRDPRVVQYVAMYAARRLAGGALFALAEPGYIIHPRGYDGSLRQYRDSTTQLASILEELRYRLALAALEQGDNTAAATGFQELIKQASFANDRVRNAQTYLVLMDRRP